MCWDDRISPLRGVSSGRYVMTEDLVYACTAWATNAQMIADVHRLGYLRDEDRVLDPTYGRGGWWRVWRPADLTGWTWGEHAPWDHSLTWDFMAMFHGDQEFDAVAFDPPYVSVGGRETTTIKGMHDAYGMGDAPSTPQGVQNDINAGLAECFRVVKKGGIVLVKVQSYISSGTLWPGTFLTYNAAIGIGFKLEDHLCHISGARPQPAGRPQQHARRNQSDLLILRRPRR